MLRARIRCAVFVSVPVTMNLIEHPFTGESAIKITFDYNPRLIPVMALIPPQPSGLSDTYRVSSIHDVWCPGVWSVSIEQGVLGDPVI